MPRLDPLLYLWYNLTRSDIASTEFIFLFLIGGDKFIVSSLSYKINNSVRTKFGSQALQKANLEGFDNLNIVKTDGFGYYEVETGKLYYATTLETKTASGAVSMNTYLMEIK